MCFWCFLWLENVVSAIYFCFFHLCRWAVVWPTGWLIYSYIDTYLYINFIASTYSSLFFSLFNDFLYTPFIESRSSFVEDISTSIFHAITPMTTNCKLNDIILDCSRFCWSFQQIPNIQRDFLSLSEFASQQCPIQCWIYLSTWHF